MLTVLLVCSLTAGTTFPMPDGWQLEKVIAGGRPEYSIYLFNTIGCIDKEGRSTVCPEPKYQTQVHLSRKILENESVAIPSDCKGTVQQQGESK